MNKYTYDEQQLKDLIEDEARFFVYNDVSTEQRFKEHQEIRNKYNPQFKNFTKQNGIKLQEILPFRGASNRWIFSKGEYSISVYFDIHCILGFHNKPYFEIYPNNDGDTDRFTEDEFSELLNEIYYLLN